MYINIYHRANNRGKYADGLYYSMLDDMDGHIPSTLIMFTCSALRYALLQWEMNNGIHSKPSKSKLKADVPDHSNYFSHKNEGGKKATSCAATEGKLLSSPGVADTYTFLMNTWNTLPESYQQRVYNNTLAAVKRQIQQVENPTPDVVNDVEAARIDNAILLEYLGSKVALEEPVMRSTDPKIPIHNNCTDDKLYIGMPVGSGDYQGEGDEIDVLYANHNARR